MGEVVLEKNTTQGRAEIRLSRYLDSAVLDVFLGGKCIGSVQRLCTIQQALGPKAAQIRRANPDITHVVGKLGITDDEAAIIRAAVETAQAEIDATPEARAWKLRDQRQKLVEAVIGWDDEAQGASDDAWERGDEAGAFVGPRVTEAKAEAQKARAALKQFDAEHPEVKAAIDKEAEERAERHMWD